MPADDQCLLMINACFWLIGAATACLLAATRWDTAFFGQAVHVLIVAGQVVGGVLVGRVGFMGAAAETVTPLRLLGVILVIRGPRWRWATVRRPRAERVLCFL